MDSRAKILAQDKLLERLSTHRRRGQRIVLASGCFDLLRACDIRHLEGARREGDVLVIGVHSEVSEQALTGDGRPILPTQGRAELVAALAAVDYVVIFDEPSVDALLAAIRPDVYAKVADETGPERNRAAELGVRIAIVGGPQRHSTRDLLARLRKPFHG